MPEICRLSNMELVWVTSAQYLGEYNIEVTFNDGMVRVVDFSKILQRGLKVFEPLRDKNVLRNFTLDPWTLTWLDGTVDIAPEALYRA